MASLSAELRVNGHSYPLTDCRFGLHQDTGARGRVSAKVRHEPVQLTLDVPDDFLLPTWAADPHKRQPAAIVFRDAASGSALETLSLPAAYCVHYGEDFVHGDTGSGAYQATVILSDPSGYTLQAGGPAAVARAPKAPEPGSQLITSSPSMQLYAGGRGPRGLGDTLGTFSKRPYDPDGCGGPIISLDWRDAAIDATGIIAVVQHTGRFEPDPANAAMIRRLQLIEQGQLVATAWDKRYYTHEIREHERYRQLGIPDGEDPSYQVWNDAHTASLEDYQLADFDAQGKSVLYHPDALI